MSWRFPKFIMHTLHTLARLFGVDHVIQTSPPGVSDQSAPNKHEQKTLRWVYIVSFYMHRSWVQLTQPKNHTLKFLLVRYLSFDAR